ncbi:MAG: hypothetical protein SH848_15770 [Saprospiraceae bacterium]|nr:hypothetical protein [Saprospiraceae bacterium]MDZ4705382.1 hypothetical protein [Saprospiraceae bacterium]
MLAKFLIYQKSLAHPPPAVKDEKFGFVTDKYTVKRFQFLLSAYDCLRLCHVMVILNFSAKLSKKHT